MILIVDDKRENILPLKKILDLHGLESDDATSGEEALIKILKNDYALIIMDVQMPGMDGFEVVETMAQSSRSREIPVIFLSAINKEKKYIFKGYEAGAVDYITKPVDVDLLILKVKAFLKIYQQKKELKEIRDLLTHEVEIRKQAQLEQKMANESLEAKVQERTSELRKKNDELELRNHELQQFSWVVSHDLKEPLRKIETFIKIIRDRYVSADPKAADYIERTVNSASRMTRQIDDLLEYSRLSRNADLQQTDINSIIDEVILDYEHIIDRKRAYISRTSIPELPGIPSQLRQLFQNLVGNALKFSKPDESPEIKIDSEIVSEKNIDAKPDANGKFCRITVSDNGIGFDEAYLDKIFVIFQSLHDRHSYEGTGIGLAIAKKIIERHNGTIGAKSQPNQGATFIVVLPLNQ
ncbi:sensor histidine kinase [Flavobacterium silvaticum]|uniref:histidine kinase n=1 Tax=Flavobacterium silvaticum TaxID=1852020 RepID=A0A972FML9_9FLAO|nr:ATP-binding protein [Flavobacterium silvaticum]NMH28015.1 response regulator [Flavobacterium silvaticum]